MFEHGVERVMDRRRGNQVIVVKDQQAARRLIGQRVEQQRHRRLELGWLGERGQRVGVRLQRAPNRFAQVTGKAGRIIVAGVERTGADAAADAREAMREASREGAPDPLDGLAERITRESNPALAFDALAVGAALDLRADDGPAFQSLRGALKRAGVTITEWSRALDVEGQRRKRAAKEAERAAMHRAALLRREGEEAERAATAEKLKAVRGERPELAAHYNQETSNGATFTMEPGRVMMDSPTAQGPKRTTLANFSAPIVAHTLELDAPDARPRGTYTLSVVLEGSETPREVDVEAERFARMEWVETALGPRAVVAPGKGARDNLRAALGYLSSPVTRQRCGFTGWIRHEGRWVYLHAGGAIGEGGAVEGLAATPPAPVDRFALPAPPMGSELERAVRAVVELLSMEPAAVTVPMVALAFHAPLGGSRCAVHVNGPADLGKSVRASLVQRLFGASMEPREGLPVSWADGSTSIGIGSVLARAGDALVVLAGYLVINLVFGNILEPRMMGRGLGLSTLVVFLSLIFWGWLLGPVGMLLSVPLTIIVKIGLEQTAGGQSIAVLLSDMSHKPVE